MNYLLEQFEIKTAQGNRISGQTTGSQYLTAYARNPINNWETPTKITIFDEGTVNKYKAMLPVSKGGILADEGYDEKAAISPRDRVFANGMMYKYDLGAMYVRKYTSDILDKDGNPIEGKKAGDVICDANGVPKIVTSIEVFCQYQFQTEPVYDEVGFPKLNDDGIPMVKIMRDDKGMPIQSWTKGWDPVTLGERMRSLLTPYASIAASDNQGTTAQQAAVVEPETSLPVFNNPSAAPQGTAPGAQAV